MLLFFSAAILFNVNCATLIENLCHCAGLYVDGEDKFNPIGFGFRILKHSPQEDALIFGFKFRFGRSSGTRKERQCLHRIE